MNTRNRELTKWLGLCPHENRRYDEPTFEDQGSWWYCKDCGILLCSGVTEPPKDLKLCQFADAEDSVLLLAKLVEKNLLVLFSAKFKRWSLAHDDYCSYNGDVFVVFSLLSSTDQATKIYEFLEDAKEIPNEQN